MEHDNEEQENDEVENAEQVSVLASSVTGMIITETDDYWGKVGEAHKGDVMREQMVIEEGNIIQMDVETVYNDLSRRVSFATYHRLCSSLS